MNNFQKQPSPTGRLTTSAPNEQYYPGTPQALAESRLRREALAQGVSLINVDFSSLEVELPSLAK